MSDSEDTDILSKEDIIAFLSKKPKNSQMLVLDENDINNNKKILKAVNQRVDFFNSKNDTTKRDFFINIRDTIIENINDKIEERETNKLNNPLTVKTVSSTIVIDSRLRDKSFTSSSNYKFTLPNPLNNVSSIKLQGYRIGTTWYTIDERNNTIAYTTTNNVDIYSENIIDINKIVLDSKNYTKQELALAFIEKFNSLGTTIEGDIQYNEVKGKLQFLDSFQGTIILSGFNIDECSLDSNYINSNFNKIESSLGYLLGFRENFTSTSILNKYKQVTSNISVGNTSLTSSNAYILLPAPVTNIRHEYFYLILDDSQQNRQTYNLNMSNRGESSNDYSFYLKNKKKGLVDENNNSSCVKSDLNLETDEEACKNNTEANLKLAEKYVNNFNVNNKPPADIAFSDAIKQEKYIPQNSIKLNISNLFHIIMFNTTLVNPALNTNTSSSEDIIEQNIDKVCRTFFGGVTITSFYLKLLDQSGIIVNLNESDWVIYIEVEQIYENAN